MQDRCVEIVNVHRSWCPMIFVRSRDHWAAVGMNDVVAEIISLTVGDARLDTAAGHPNREAPRMMITTIVFTRQITLAVNGAAKFTAPDHKRVIEHAT